MPSIPASQLVNVTPGVLGVGGATQDLVGLILTDATRVPIGSVLSFPDQASVAAYFGASSTEASVATNYFLANDNSLTKPGALLFAQYNGSAVAAYLRGGSLAGVSLATLQGYSGTITVTVDGTSKTSSPISLSGATSFSNAATIIQAAFTSPNFAVTYDATASAFVFTSNTTGASSTITFGTGTAVANLKLTAATGAVLSQGAAASTPATAMAAIYTTQPGFSGFTSTFEPVSADKVAFASWANSTGNKMLYAMWDTSTPPTTSSDTTSAGYQIIAASYSGTFPIWAASVASGAAKGAFVLGVMAALDFQQQNGRTTFAFRSQSGLTADVTDATIAANLLTNGYNYYGAYANASTGWNILYDGGVTGPFLWADTFVNQIWLNASLQTSLVNLLVNSGSIPYNADGRALIESACQDTINTALNFGAIRTGVTLSASQIAQVNAAAGANIANTLQTRGWYLKVGVASSAVRVARQSPPCTFWYVDGQSVQKIDLASIELQ